MELRLLKYFWTVATAGTVSKAAEQLYITQPTLSRQIKELERELDTQLFMRDGKKLVLTEDGQFLKIKAEEILQLTSKTVKVFEDRKKGGAVDRSRVMPCFARQARGVPAASGHRNRRQIGKEKGPRNRVPEAPSHS